MNIKIKIKPIINLVLGIMLVVCLIGFVVALGVFKPGFSINLVTITDNLVKYTFGVFLSVTGIAINYGFSYLQKNYEKAIIGIDLKDAENPLREILKSVGRAGRKRYYEAERYLSQIVAINTGKDSARNVHIKLEQLTFEEFSKLSVKNYTVSGRPIIWSGTKNTNMDIASTSKEHIDFLEIFGLNTKGASVNGEKGIAKPQISIAGSDEIITDYNGIFTCKYKIYSDNASPVTLIIEIRWNGKIAMRLSEMKANIQIKNITNGSDTKSITFIF